MPILWRFSRRRHYTPIPSTLSPKAVPVLNGNIPGSLALMPSLSVSLVEMILRRTRYRQDFYKLDAYYATYANAVFPPNTDAVAANTVADPLIPLTEDDVLPPNTRRQPGRPKKRRIRGGTKGGDRGARHAFRCSRCGSTGHSRRTCRQPV